MMAKTKYSNDVRHRKFENDEIRITSERRNEMKMPKVLTKRL